MFKAKCPLCNGTYQAKTEWIGKQAPCPHCHKRIVIQADGTEPALLVVPIHSEKDDNIKPTEHVANTNLVDCSIPTKICDSARDDNFQSEAHLALLPQMIKPETLKLQVIIHHILP